MDLKDKIKSDFKEAFRAKDKVQISVLKMLQAELNNVEISKRAGSGEFKFTDEEVLIVISKEAKKRKDAIEAYDKAGRDTLRDQEKSELDILSAYLPEQMGEDEIRQLVEKAVEKSGAKNVQEIGKVMAILMPQTKGKADGALVNKIVRENLA